MLENQHHRPAYLFALVMVFALSPQAGADLEWRNTSPWSADSLSQARSTLAGASAGNTIIFAGGLVSSSATDIVDIFNVATSQWSVSNLSESRESLVAASSGNLIFFGGGNTDVTQSDVVDIFDTSTGQWVTTENDRLSEARNALAAAGAASKVLFAGGSGDSFASSTVDIYDTSTHSWTTANLSHARTLLAATAWDNKIYIAGGINESLDWSDVVDVYDATSDTWTTLTMPQAQAEMTAVSAGGKIFFAGGTDADGFITDMVQIYDTQTDSWLSATLSQSRSNLAAMTDGTKVYFGGGTDGVDQDRVDIYDTVADSWTIATLAQARYTLATASAGGKIFFAGGFNSDTGDSDVVDIYDSQAQHYTEIDSSQDFTLLDNTIVNGRMHLSFLASLNVGDFDLTVGSMSGDAPILITAGHTLTTGTDNTTSTYAGVLSGDGGMVKTGTGALDLTGENTYTGNTSIQNGLLSINGAIAGDVIVDAPGTLGGSGNIGGSVTNSGTVAPGNSIAALHIAGDFTSPEGSTLEIELNSTGQCDKLEVDGAATLEHTTIVPLPAPGRYTMGTQYNFLTAAGGLEATFDDSELTISAIINFALEFDASNAYLTVLSRNTYLSQADTPNQKAVAEVLDGIAEPTEDMADVVGTLDFMNQSQLQNALDGISGASLDSYTSAGLGGARSFISTVARHGSGSSPYPVNVSNKELPGLADGLQFASAADTAQILQMAYQGADKPDSQYKDGDNTFWASGISSWSGHKSQRNIPGCRLFSSGVVTGIDRKMSDELTLGMSLGGIHSDINLLDGAGYGSLDAAHTALSARWAAESFYSDGQLGFGYNWFDSTRRIPSLGRKAESDHTGQDYSARIGGGYDWQLGNWLMGPTAWLQYVNLQESGFKEHGAGSLDLDVNGRNSESLQSGLGLRAATVWNSGGTKIAPSLRAEWVHEYQNDPRSMRAVLAGAPASPFVVRGLSSAENNIVLGTGLDAYFTRDVSVFVNYDLWLPCESGVMVGHALSGGVKVTF